MPKHERRTHEKPDTTQKNIYVGRRQLSLEERLSRQIRGQYRDIKTVEDWESSEEDQREAADFEMPERKEFGEGYEIGGVEARLKADEEARAMKAMQKKEAPAPSNPEGLEAVANKKKTPGKEKEKEEV